MSFINSGLFWFIEGILFILSINGIKIYLEDKNIQMTYLKWSSVIGWLLLLFFTIGFITTSLGEYEPIAALRGGLIFGFLTLIAGLIGLRIIRK